MRSDRSTVIDAPISGGVAGARAGTLAMMVSGNPAKVAELMPVFRRGARRSSLPATGRGTRRR